MNILLLVMLSAAEFRIFTKSDLYIFLFVLVVNLIFFSPMIFDVLKKHQKERELENRGVETTGEVAGVISKGVYTTREGVAPVKIGDGTSARDLSLATRLMAPRSLYYFKKDYDGIYIEYYVGTERHEIMYPTNMDLHPGDTFPMLYLPEKPQVAKIKFQPVTELLPAILKILAGMAISIAFLSLILMIVW